MRNLVLVGVSATLAVAGCAHAPPLRPAIPEQVVPGDARAATAEVAGVRVTVRADDFGGWIGDLEDAATPVAITVENDSGRAIRVRPRLFALIGPTGFRYEPLGRREVRALVRSHEGYGYYGYPGFYPGFYGGFGGPWWGWPGAYPFFGWGVYWAPPPPAAPPSVSAGTRQPSGILQDGGDIDLLLFYPVPAGKLDSAIVQATLVAQDGTRLGIVQVPFVRGKAAPPPMAGGAEPPTQPGTEAQPPPPPPEARRAQKPGAPKTAEPPPSEPGAEAQPPPAAPKTTPPPPSHPQPPASEPQPPTSQPQPPAPGQTPSPPTSPPVAPAPPAQ